MSLFAGSLTAGKLLNGGLFLSNAQNPAFITTWDTTKSGVTGSTSIRIPLVPGVSYDFTVDWGDGNSEHVSGSALSNKDHIYLSSGIYTVTITGTFPRIYFNNGGDKLKLLTIENLGSVGWQSFNSAFRGCANNTKCSGYVDWGTITDFSFAWQNNKLTAWTTGLPASLRNCSIAWHGNSLTSWAFDLPASLENCAFAWYGNNITTWTGGGWSGVTDATNALASGTNAINTADYNTLLIKIEANNNNNNVPFHFGNSKYSGAGATARAALIADHADTITDGGPA